MPIGKNTLTRLAQNGDGEMTKKTAGIVSAAPEVPVGDPATPSPEKKTTEKNTTTKNTTKSKSTTKKSTTNKATNTVTKNMSKSTVKSTAVAPQEKDRFFVVHVGDKMPYHLL